MNIFYKNVSKKHLQKLFEERDYYLEHANSRHVSRESKESYALMADFYDALIVAAQKHISEHLKP